MNAIEFKEQTVIIAKDQPQYLPLPAHVSKDGEATFCMQLNKEELEEVAKTGKLWMTIHTFNQPLQPIRMSTQNPFK